jgi:hypothetical protein
MNWKTELIVLFLALFFLGLLNVIRLPCSLKETMIVETQNRKINSEYNQPKMIKIIVFGKKHGSEYTMKYLNYNLLEDDKGENFMILYNKTSDAFIIKNNNGYWLTMLDGNLYYEPNFDKDIFLNKGSVKYYNHDLTNIIVNQKIYNTDKLFYLLDHRDTITQNPNVIFGFEEVPSKIDVDGLSDDEKKFIGYMN